MDSSVQQIPESLIYEMVDGSPIYYKGYKRILKENLQTDEIMGSSILQSALATKLLIVLFQTFGKKYFLFSNELGIQFEKNSWRSADLAIVETEKLEGKTFDNHYLDFPPKVVIEIDTKADLDEIEDTFGYYHKKTKELLAFGVEKVVWIYTDLQSILIADQQQEWQIVDWNKDITLLEELKINVSQIVEDLPG